MRASWESYNDEDESIRANKPKQTKQPKEKTKPNQITNPDKQVDKQARYTNSVFRSNNQEGVSQHTTAIRDVQNISS